MKRYTGLKVIAVLAVMVAVVFFAFRFSKRSLESLQGSVTEAMRPDAFLHLLESVHSTINGAESGVRAFAITHDEDFLKTFRQARTGLEPSIDSLEALADGQELAPVLKEYRALALQKLDVYQELMLISYSEIFDSALVEIAGHIPAGDSTVAGDTASSAETKRSFLQKIFGGGPSRQEMQARIDSALSANRRSGERMMQARRALSLAQQRRNKLVQERMEKELTVLARDKVISDDMERVVGRIKALHAAGSRQRTEAAGANAWLMVRNMEVLVVAGLTLIVLLTVLILVDIVKGARHRDELTAARAEAERFARLKEEFLAHMSHEIRTPLTSILGYTGRMARTSLNEKQSYYLRNIETSSEHLLSVVNDILDISRIDSGKLAFEKTPFTPSAVVDEVCAVMQIKAAEKDVGLLTNTYGIRGVRVAGDPMRLRQVLFNLVGNAIKFTDHGSVSVKARRAEVPSGDGEPVRFEFTVSDTGAGIPQAQLRNLFNEYVQADESISRRYGGSGLGLSICKKIVEQQGGTIAADSQPGRGSVFTFTVPFEVITRTERAAPVPSPEGDLKGIRVLLAEDVEVNRALQEEMLAGLGAEVRACADGREALDAFDAFGPDIVLMDIQMPGMGGMEAIRALRGRGVTAPVVAMTANARPDDRTAYRENGFDDVLTKPFREAELASCIRRLTGRRADTPATERAAGETGVPHYELQDLRDASRGNNDFVMRMLKLFLMSGDSILGKAEVHARDGEWEQVGALAHRLIPSCRQLSVHFLTEKLQAVEALCQDGPDADRIGRMLQEARQGFGRLRKALEAEIDMLEQARTSTRNP